MTWYEALDEVSVEHGFTNFEHYLYENGEHYHEIKSMLEKAVYKFSGKIIINPAAYLDPEEMYTAHGLKLVETCGGCPEQYDVFTEDGIQVGYLRLRHGTFRVDYPACGDEVIYLANPQGDGVFQEDERMEYLAQALIAIRSKL